MPVNSHRSELWKADIAQSIKMYNEWFIQFAPMAYRDSRIAATDFVKRALAWTDNFTSIEPGVLREHPSVLHVLRMITSPPLARDRLIGLARVSPTLVRSMEIDYKFPLTMASDKIDGELLKISQMIMRLVDREMFPWLQDRRVPSEFEMSKASAIVVERLCEAVTDPLIRNTQEKRQLNTIGSWLEARGYTQSVAGAGLKFSDMLPGTFSFRLNVPVRPVDEQGQEHIINIPIDAVIMPRYANVGDFPLLIEAKSAGDFTNTNKRRKEEATKITQLQKQYGKHVRFVLFLCGYFDRGYLTYEAREGIDWVWEHRIDDLKEFGV
jgi:hypothetical protein